MPRLLIMIAGWLLSSAIKKLLFGAGLGLFSYSVIQTLFDRYFHYFFVAGYGQFPTAVYNLLALGGIDHFISVIVGALIARVALNAMSVSLTRA